METCFLEVLEDFSDVLDMLCFGLRVDEYIVEVSGDIVVKSVKEDVVDIVLEGCWRALEAE